VEPIFTRPPSARHATTWKRMVRGLPVFIGGK